MRLCTVCERARRIRVAVAIDPRSGEAFCEDHLDGDE